MDLEMALAALDGQVVHGFTTCGDRLKARVRIGFTSYLGYLGFEVYMAPSTLRIFDNNTLLDFACFTTAFAVVSLV